LFDQTLFVSSGPARYASSSPVTVSTAISRRKTSTSKIAAAAS